MLINHYLTENNISIYALAEKTDLAYSTVRHICSGKADIRKCRHSTVEKIASALDISTEDVELLCEQKYSFSLFKSSYHHKAKREGEIGFVTEILKSGDVERYWRLRMYRETFYLVAMVDYYSRKNGINLYSGYNHIRMCKLKDKSYSEDVLLEYALTKDPKVLEEAEEHAIPEFLHYNLIEGGLEE